MYAYIHTKSVKSVCSSRISRASQSPNKVEKQPKSTPDMQTLPPIERARTDIYISTRTFIVAIAASYKLCEGFEKSQTTSINAFLCYVALVFTSSGRGCTDCYAVGSSGIITKLRHTHKWHRLANQSDHSNRYMCDLHSIGHFQISRARF